MTSIFDSPEFNQVLFFPRRDDSPQPQGTDEIYIEVETDIRVHVRRHPNPAAKFSLLYFHGNGEIVRDYDSVAPFFAKLGAELVVCDYRGYGKSNGTPTLRALLSDARTVYQTLHKMGKLLARICIMGRSLGSGPAIELAVNIENIDACVIESGYADPLRLLARRGIHLTSLGPQGKAFDNGDKIRAATCPLLIMHGADDTLIFPDEAQLNYQRAGSQIKHLAILDGVGHNNIWISSDYFPTLENFWREVFNNKNHKE